jgi:hypothetical protein
MSYLARLKRLGGEKYFTHSPETVLTKLPKAPSVSSVSSIPAHIEKIHAANDGENIRLATYPDAVAAEPIAEMPGNLPSIFQAEIAVDRNSFILPTIADTDDRRTCSQCLNLRGRICGIAKPEARALVVANAGYRPQADTLHRCAGYLPDTNDTDQRPGGERWLGLIQKGNE